MTSEEKSREGKEQKEARVMTRVKWALELRADSKEVASEESENQPVGRAGRGQH